jgi:chemotaxis protein CheD
MNIVSAQDPHRLNVHPGDWYFGRAYKNIYTVLGSCVSLTAWHAELKTGGLCHFILPGAPAGIPHSKLHQHKESGRYAKVALALMKQAMLRHAPLQEYTLGLYGGNDTLGIFDIGKQNIQFAQQWLLTENLTPQQIDVGGCTSRTLVFNLASGVVHVKKY